MFDIIICTYNGEKILKRVIDSIIIQNRYEELVNNFFIVDNNSKDNTKEIIQKYEKEDNKVKYLFQEKQGLSNARLKGVENSISDWIIFIDDDNILEQNWLIYVKEYIESNENMGAFNGSVIPLIEEELTEEEEINLKNVYQGLACTHLSKEDIDFSKKFHPCKMPFGAGLVIKADEMRELAKKGWLKSEGRKGSELISGEDTEMVNYIIEKGYSVGYQVKAIINHIIDKKRLKREYLIKLYKSFERYSVKKSLKRRLKYYIREIIIKICFNKEKMNYEEKLKFDLRRLSIKELMDLKKYKCKY